MMEVKGGEVGDRGSEGVKGVKGQVKWNKGKGREAGGGGGS